MCIYEETNDIEINGKTGELVRARTNRELTCCHRACTLSILSSFYRKRGESINEDREERVETPYGN